MQLLVRCFMRYYSPVGKGVALLKAHGSISYVQSDEETYDMRPTAQAVRETYFGELKPCPFCGGKARFSVVHSPDYESPAPDEGGEYIECTNNRCRATTMLIFPTMADAKPLLVGKWNSRI